MPYPRWQNFRVTYGLGHNTEDGEQVHEDGSSEIGEERTEFAHTPRVQNHETQQQTHHAQAEQQRHRQIDRDVHWL